MYILSLFQDGLPNTEKEGEACLPLTRRDVRRDGPDTAIHTTRRISSRRDSSRTWIFAAGLLLGAVSMAVVSAISSLTIQTKTHHELSQVVKMKPRTFEHDPRFASPSSPEADLAWGSITPSGDGFVVVDNARKLGLPQGINSPHGELYDVSLFHQLHCLKQMRNVLYTLVELIKADTNNTQTVYNILVDPQMDHISHCFDYIRQALMCAGDMTLEWPRTEKDGSRVAVDGWGVTHQCKSWEAILTIMEHNRPPP